MIALEHIVQKLPKLERDIILYILLEKSERQIAKIIGVSKSTIHWHKIRAYRFLREIESRGYYYKRKTKYENIKFTGIVGIDTSTGTTGIETSGELFQKASNNFETTNQGSD